MDKLHISFVIPAFNCAKTIKESIDSIFDRNFEDGDEVIIVNDFSTDETEKEILKLRKKYPEIVYIKNESNKGCPASRNIGIRRAKNTIIFNLDGDNVLKKGSIKKLKKYLISENADVAAFSDYHYFISDTKKINHYWKYKGGMMTLADFLAGPINPGPGGNFMFTKKSWENIGGFWEYGKGLHEAWGNTLKFLGNGATFVVLPHSFYFHRIVPNSLFVRESEKTGESSSLMATQMMMNFVDLLKDEDAEYIKSDWGSKNWFENFFAHPLHLKSGELGITGIKTSGRWQDRLKQKIKKYTPNSIKALVRSQVKTRTVKLRFEKEFKKFQTLSESRPDFVLNKKDIKLSLEDNTSETNFDTHYIYHPA